MGASFAAGCALFAGGKAFLLVGSNVFGAMSESDFLLLICVAIAVNGVIGCVVGSVYNLKVLGTLLGFILGPIGWLVVFAVGVGKNHRERMELESYALARRSAPAPVAAPAPVENFKLRIRRNGAVLGQWPLYEVRDYLEQGSLVWEDEYFDRSLNSWVQLSGHPEV